jgi:Asp-tRNA(Asn)/Glu-tRNA(Gln) amidotransferase A subunit family amidase
MNLTGHPTLVVAFGKDEEQRRPRTVALTAKMFSEAVLLDVGTRIQQAMPPVVIE